MNKIKVVIDTNIFVSAFLGSKNAKLILKEIINGEFLLIMSTEQLRELKEVLNRPKFSKYITLREVEELIALLSMKVIVPACYEKVTDCRDPKDNMILEEAVYGNAQYIITGDDDLLVLNPYKWINIVNLRNFITEIYDL
ncbi:putative toxin-antitoxin system toxin component, PIN family [Clostridium sp.]|uniref:putative toxin-antitoxin system toxin component, PIN family n=1 Tax=Clostridium sp. TaxID=1506 RepID=UPI003D6C9A2D